MELKEILLKLSNAYAELKTKYPISKLGVFGSVARGEALESSDVDILVEF
ncbi:MAG: nucleotidyltransferase domain-containing protein, partial [Cytophagales bacterium]|nr:nucleotidyltransferase domain-containing protein [Cytophagales bacterium]